MSSTAFTTLPILSSSSLCPHTSSAPTSTTTSSSTTTKAPVRTSSATETVTRRSKSPQWINTPLEPYSISTKCITTAMSPILSLSTAFTSSPEKPLPSIPSSSISQHKLPALFPTILSSSLKPSISATSTSIMEMRFSAISTQDSLQSLVKQRLPDAMDMPQELARLLL